MSETLNTPTIAYCTTFIEVKPTREQFRAGRLLLADAGTPRAAVFLQVQHQMHVRGVRIAMAAMDFAGVALEGKPKVSQNQGKNNSIFQYRFLALLRRQGRRTCHARS